MEARTRKDGQITYRFHPLQPDGTRGKPINLGTDKALAIRQVLDMASRAPDQGTIGQLWRLYEQSPDFTRLADGTKRQYRECWRQLAKVFEHGLAAAIRPADVARYLRVERAAAPVVANREVAVLSNLPMRSSTGAVCRRARGNFFEILTRAGIGLAAVRSQGFMASCQGILDGSRHQHRQTSRQHQPRVQPQPARPLHEDQPADRKQLVHFGQDSISVRASLAWRSAIAARSRYAAAHWPSTSAPASAR